MPFLGDARRRSTILLAGGVILVFVLLGALQWFNTSKVNFLDPATYGQTIFLTALEGLLFLLLLLLLVLLFRIILKVYVGQGVSGLGARLRSRMVLGAVIITLTPAALMFLFSYLLMNRSLERWFSPNSSELREDSRRVVLELADYVAANARGEAESIAASGALDKPLPQLQQALDSHRITLDGGFIVVYGKDRRERASFQAPSEATPASLRTWMDDARPPAPMNGPLSAALLAAAERSDVPTLLIGGAQYAPGMAMAPSGEIVVAALPMPEGLNGDAARIRASAAEYWQLFRSRNRVRTMLFLMLLLVTVFVFFSSVWLAVFLSKQITRPVESLADAMDKISAGKYSHRVESVATGEMADLVRSFNHMAADLDTSRQLAESSQAQLTAANQAIEERRRELETIVETIPSGVVTLDGTGTVLQANRAFAELIGARNESGLAGKQIEALFPAECAEDVASVIRRGQRMGAASAEIEFSSRGRILHLAVTGARLELSHGRAGTVLAVEDTTELLRAQRQLAWKEVAQRVAHEIKNPLTPIALSAERIGRHLDRGQPGSASVIRKCSQVILNCVGTLRSLVDQFSALAEFPASHPRPCCVNQVVEEALALFGGRLEGISIESDAQPDLPVVLADPEAIRRALANLIDNAAEAMQGSLLRVLQIQTAVSEDGAAVEVVVADTGHGLTDQMRERLFLPFYSTKHRGTGLGLAIAAKIAQEHGGTIRAESNAPKGARFTLRLPLIEPNGSAAEPAVEPAAADAYPAARARS